MKIVLIFLLIFFFNIFFFFFFFPQSQISPQISSSLNPLTSLFSPLLVRIPIFFPNLSLSLKPLLPTSNDPDLLHSGPETSGSSSSESVHRSRRSLTRIYRCRFCQTHLAIVGDLISRSFQCRQGKAYLFNNVANVSVGDLEDRMLISGLHTVADIFCCNCGQIVGWKYEATHVMSQKYKEGKFVLERGRIVDGIGSGIYVDTNLNGSDAGDKN